MFRAYSISSAPIPTPPTPSPPPAAAAARGLDSSPPPPSPPPPPPPIKPETPVEKVIREVKEELQQEKLEQQQQAAAEADSGKEPKPAAAAAGVATPAAVSTTTSAVNTPAVPIVATAPVAAVSAAVAPKKPLWDRVKEEALHYWHGLKLLGAETSISLRLIRKLLRGETLTRREDRQLKRTVGDLLRLVPVIIILVVPFMELALPFLLYLFPNMLPSTFESKSQVEEKRQKLLKVRLEMAKFLQDTVADVAVSGSSKAKSAQEFTEFFSTYRATGIQAPTEEILRVAKKFGDELTLNNLSRPQLISMARYMNLSAFGTDNYLRHQIDTRLRYLQADDQQILREGVDSLTLPEIQQICQSRGIRTVGVSPARLKSELNQWLELHIKHHVPSTLLVLSRAFVISEKIPANVDEALKGSAASLQATLSSLPDEVVNEAKLQIADVAGTATYQQRLDVLKEQEELIKTELEQEQIQAATKKGIVGATATPIVPASSAIEELDPISEAQFKELGEAIKIMASESAVANVKEQLSELKEEVKEYKEDVEELQQLTQKPAFKAARSVSDRVNRMIEKIEAEIAQYEPASASAAGGGGGGAGAGEGTAAAAGATIRPDSEGRLTVAELEHALQVLRDHPGDERITKIVKRLDTDGDGFVSLPEILAICEMYQGQGEAAAAAREREKEGKDADESAKKI
ncbi:LETM1-like protein-domain-containing protein [Zopfochytrium polystomum]|nr:LETM1-like protein-domain-containing protein [Zopfochytrium polystomum]